MTKKKATPKGSSPSTWRELRAKLVTCSEQEAAEWLRAERAGERRPMFLNALYGRFAKLRAMRERQELFQ